MSTLTILFIFLISMVVFLSGFVFGYKEYLKDTSERKEYPTGTSIVGRKNRVKRIYPPRRRRIFS